MLNSSTQNFPQSKKNIESLIGKSIKVNNTKNGGLVKFSIANTGIRNAINSLKTVVEYNKQIQLDNNKVLKIERHISSGTYGSVYSGKLNINKTQHNIIVKKQELKKNDSDKSIILEVLINILLKTDKIIYKFVPKYYGSYKIENSICIINDYISDLTFDNLIKILSKNKTNSIIANNVICSIFLQILLTLNVMQKRYNFTHGDLKTNNIMILLTQQPLITINKRKFNPHGYTFKYIDFGFSCMTSYTQTKFHVPHYYSDNICGNKYLDVLFLSVYLCIDLQNYKLTHLKIYSFLVNRINKLLKEVNIKRGRYISVKNDLVNGKIFNNFMMFTNNAKKSKGHLAYELLKSISNMKNKNFDLFSPENIYVDFTSNMGIDIKKV